MACKRPDGAVDQDPDYENITVHQAKRIKLLEKDAKEASVKKIANIIKSQFADAIAEKRYEIDVADQRLHQAHMMLDRLRAYIVASYYSTEERCSKEMGRALAYQTSMHPAVKELLLGKRPRSSSVALPNSLQVTPCSSSSISRPSSTITTSGCSSLTHGSPEFASASVSPEFAGNNLRAVSAPVSPDIFRASRFKAKKRIIVGNVSRYIPMDKREENDQSTHKWMVYVRGPKEEPVLDHFVKKVWFFLHPSYRPNDLVEISQPPFHLTRRGWGEFPVRVQLHFHDPRNKRVDIIHKLKLDKTYTGLQTLGSETVVDILVYKSVQSASRLVSGLQEGINRLGDDDSEHCTVTAATVAAPGRRNLQFEDRTTEHTVPEAGCSDSSIMLANIKIEPCDTDEQSEESLARAPVLNMHSNDSHSNTNKSPKCTRSSDLQVTTSPHLKISNLSVNTFNKETTQASSVVQTSGSTDSFSCFVSPTRTSFVPLTHSATSNVLSTSANAGAQTFVSMVNSKVGASPAQFSTNATSISRQSKLEGVSVLQKSLLNSNHVVDQANAPNQGPLRILQGDAFTKPVLIVPKAAKSATASSAENAKTSAPPALIASGQAKSSVSTVPPTTPLLIIPTLPKSSPKVSTLNNSLSPSFRTQISSPPLHTVSNVGLELPKKAAKPVIGSNQLQPGVSLIKPPNSSVSAAPAPTNPATSSNNFYIKCVDKHGNIFLVRVPSANNVKPRVPNAAATQGSSPTTTITPPISTPPPLINRSAAACPSTAQSSSLPTYLLQLVPSKPGASMQGQLVRLPLPNSALPPPTPSSTSNLTLGRPSYVSALSSPHSLAVTKTSSSVVSNAFMSSTDAIHQSSRIAINIDQLHSMADILKCFVKQFPITSSNPDRTQHPYCASSPETFLSWYIGKQRASEWQRAKAVRNAILEAFSHSKRWNEKKVWSTKEILWWCRRYGHTPVKPVPADSQESVLGENDSLNTYTEAKGFLSQLEEQQVNLARNKDSVKDDEVEVDILSVEEPRKPRSTSKELPLNSDLKMLLRLPASSEVQLVNSQAASIGVKFQPVEVRPGVVASLAEMMILAASKIFVEDILRESLAKGFQRLGGNRCPNTITVEDVHTSLHSRPECDFLTNKYLGKGIVKCLTKEDT